MYTNSWNSGNHFMAFWMMDFRNDTSFWCSASLSYNSILLLAAVRIEQHAKCAPCHTRSGRSSTHSKAGTADARSYRYASQSTLQLTTRRLWHSENSPQAGTPKASSVSILAKRERVCPTTTPTRYASARAAISPRAN